MNDYERIESLYSEGRITREQADQLINALSAADEAEQELPEQNGVQYSNGAAATDDWTTDRQTATEVPKFESSSVDPSVRWLEIVAFGGDVDVRVNAELTEPRIKEGHLELTDTGARVAPWEEKNDGVPRNFIDRMIDGFRQSDMDIEIPAGWAVRFDLKGGDIDLDGPVEAVSGHLRAGELTVSDTRAVDVTVTAGEADIGLRACQGDHKVNVRVGSATIRLLPGSSLEVEGNVSIGDLKAKGLDAVERGLGGWGKGLLSNGSADSRGRLNAAVVTGDLSIRVADHG